VTAEGCASQLEPLILWEKTPFFGTMDDVVSAMLATMQHLVADY
jgi:hypothetical protein